MRRIENSNFESIIQNAPAKEFFKNDNVLEFLNKYLNQSSSAKAAFYRLQTAVKNLSSEKVTLSLLLKQMENYIILQQLRDADVIDYIQENREQIDSVLNCIITLMQKILPQLEDENKTK